MSINQVTFGFIALLILTLSIHRANAQKASDNDSVFFLAKKKGILGKIGRSISVNAVDPPIVNGGIIKNETVYDPYKGKLIRKIKVKAIPFDKSIHDTSKSFNNFLNKLGDAIHIKTKDKTISKNLFFQTGDSVFPALIADNERFLRTLPYLQDAKIFINPIAQQSDSVDLEIIYKDLFPIGGSAEVNSINKMDITLNDENPFGNGNRISFSSLIDQRRSNPVGIGFSFLKRNLLGSFTDIEIGYRNEGPAFNSGRREEKELYLIANLPLVSPYHRLTGGFLLVQNATQNQFISDSLYQSNFKYAYRIADGWMGYILGAKSKLSENFTSRKKSLISIRFTNRGFYDQPNIYKNKYEFLYSDISSFLSSYTLFEQDFYHTNFLFGFGRNEDVPEGFRLSLVGGWTNRENVSRPYLGVDYQRAYFSNKKNYLNFGFKMGSYYRNGSLEDISLLGSLEFFTKLRHFGTSKWHQRQFFTASATQLINTILNQPLKLNSEFGNQEFQEPNLAASTRITLKTESVFYNIKKWFGFNFAPFLYTQLTYLKPIGGLFASGNIYSSGGLGIRTRNENLVFGTMELRVHYYPVQVNNMNNWNITFSSNLRYKYVTELIRKPEFAIVN